VYQTSEQHWRTRVHDARVGGSDNSDTRFEKLRELGRGAFGTVDEVKEETTQSVYARKSIPIRMAGLDPDIVQRRVENEVQVMAKLRHNHIASINLHFRSEHHWSIIMLPVAECDLHVFLEERCVRKNYPRSAMRMLDPWFGCLISALAYAHHEKVKHEDIKPSNILIKDSKIYLTDFGTAKDFSENDHSRVSDYAEQGTPAYWAPERRPWGRPADVFALGCVFSEMLTVRQKRSLQEYRRYRHTPSAELGYAYRSNLDGVRTWLTKELPGITDRDTAAQVIAEQTLNMLIEVSDDRPDARRVKHQLRAEETLFCATCC